VLSSLPLRDLLGSFSSSDPTPGGGSAAALTGALGAALLAMVAGLPRTRTGAPQERAALDAARVELLRLQEALRDLVDRDSAAYDLVVAALKQPKGTDQEKAARAAAIQDAMRVATEAPVETFVAAAKALAAGRAVARDGNPSATSDIAVGIHSLMAAMQGAMFNVEINIGSVKDASLVERLTSRLRSAQSEATAAFEAIARLPNMLELMGKVGARLSNAP
jgi:formiminotetrahydrofolate cyclodeaminase